MWQDEFDQVDASRHAGSARLAFNVSKWNAEVTNFAHHVTNNEMQSYTARLDNIWEDGALPL